MIIGKPELYRISKHVPVERPEESLLKAAVALILRDSVEGTQFLLMQRAKHDGDPWSGQMSFPGGKIDPEDTSAKAAAMREAYEEVGVSLLEEDYVGRLDDLYGLKVDGVFSVHVSCFVFKIDRELNLIANHEVADMVWLPISYLDDAGNKCDFGHPKDPSVKMPAVMIDEAKDQILWGLTLRMMAMLHELLGWPMRVLTEQQKGDLKSIEDRNLSRKQLDAVAQQALLKDV